MEQSRDGEFWSNFDRLNKAQKDFAASVSRRFRTLEREVEDLKRSTTRQNCHPQFDSLNYYGQREPHIIKVYNNITENEVIWENLY